MNITEPKQAVRRLSLEPGEDRVLALSLAYLRAGLSPDDAIDAALADFVCAEPEEALCLF
jgi:hypothetical protein